VLPRLDGKLNGMAVRVPTPTVSLVDLTVEIENRATKEEINAAFEKAANNELSGILGYETRPLVSIDYKMDSRSSIIDAQSTQVVGGNLTKVIAWYDNEWGYANRLVDLAGHIAR
jgi:glyceraldehyde 3-phosphate dehydrogenase